MATTPEGKVKRKVSALLKQYAPNLWYDMPVPGGYGNATLDYVGWLNGKAFAVETKAPGKKPTDRQKQTISRMQRAGAAVFVVDGDTSELHKWLEVNKG